jgi:dTDP-4-amino-4,6-dideoxygalactose transaminase
MSAPISPNPNYTAYKIHLSTPDVGRAEEEAVIRALRSGWVAPLGPELIHFEQELAALAGREHALAVSSGTAALHLALLCSGVSKGDVVPCSTMTFVATANAIMYTGAIPYFVDCDQTGNMDPRLLADALEELASSGARIGAVLIVDMLGKIANYEAIGEIAAAYSAPVISDSAESLGARRGSRPAGSFGDCAVFSFNGNKIVTTAGGGALLSNDKEFIERARYLSSQARQPVVHYEHMEVGYNYRLSNVLAALGRAQLERLPEFLTRRRAIRAAYRDLCTTMSGVEIFGGADDGDNCWLTGIVIDPYEAGFSAHSLSGNLQLAGVETRPIWKPMHLQPVFADAGSFPRLINGTAEQFFNHGLVLPSGQNTTARDLAVVLEVIENHYAEYPVGNSTQFPEALPLARSAATSNHASTWQEGK